MVIDTSARVAILFDEPERHHLKKLAKLLGKQTGIPSQRSEKTGQLGIGASDIIFFALPTLQSIESV